MSTETLTLIAAVVLTVIGIGAFFHYFIWVAVLTLIAAGSLVPPIAGFLLAPDAIGRSLDFGSWLILNPFSPFRHQIEDYAIRFGLFFAAVMAVCAGKWFLDQAQAFRPPPADDEAEAPLRLIADRQAEGS